VPLPAFQKLRVRSACLKRDKSINNKSPKSPAVPAVPGARWLFVWPDSKFASHPLFRSPIHNQGRSGRTMAYYWNSAMPPLESTPQPIPIVSRPDMATNLTSQVRHIAEVTERYL
jgi:hypothetical protein